MNSPDVVDDSFTENNLDISKPKSDTTTESFAEEVDDSIESSPRLSNHESDEEDLCLSTKIQRRRPIILSESESEPDETGSDSSGSDPKTPEIIEPDEIGSNPKTPEIIEPDETDSVPQTPEIIDLSSEDEQSQEVNEKLYQPTLHSMVQKLTLKQETEKPLKINQPTSDSMVQVKQETKPVKINKPTSTMVQNHNLKQENAEYYCSAAEYSNQANKVANLRTDSLKCKNALRTVNLDSLPDKGALLRQRQFTLEKQLETEETKLKKMVLETKAPQEEKKISWDQLVANSNCVVPKTFGKQAMNTYSNQKSLTMDRLKNLHDSLATCPDENTLAEDPRGLKIELMPHQRRALAWLVWREGQKPAGGILADDMGLGKTLTMISLVLATKEDQLNEDKSEDSEEENKEPEWRSKSSRKLNAAGGTLVICPATLIGQWENEIHNRLKRNLLTVEVFHGAKRETRASRLARHDVVITTYALAQNEFKNRGPLFGVKWRRIILDEAHVVRNHKSQTSTSVCALKAHTRWALTGTPVHNKELDLYALLKFLRCSPFDDLTVWKQWVANKNAGGQDRLNTVMTSILLRRTKVQLQMEGALKDALPEKEFEEIFVHLDDEEKGVYQKVLMFSRNLFIEFLRQREEGPYGYGARRTEPQLAPGTNDAQYDKMHRKMMEMYGGSNIKSAQILVLLLRLRQICCHPSLIHAILDDDISQTEGIPEAKTEDIFEKFANMNLEDDTPAAAPTPALVPEPQNFNAIANKILSAQNPVFQEKRSNDKLRTIQRIIEEKVLPRGDKIIIVSQWTSMLKIIQKHLKLSKIRCDLLDGSVPVHKRNDLVESFNDARQPIKVLLLSLTAGGVGLNLVGANHLLLTDLHWNPQLEAQAQDRIYRMGQMKTVFVYKIITSETIEERIKALQDRKLTMASDILSGTRAAAGTKLSLDDLKMLFNIGPQQQP